MLDTGLDTGLDDTGCDGAGPRVLAEVARTRLAAHYETGREDVPALTVCTPQAVRLPASVVTAVLPRGDLAVSGGRLREDGTTWRVTRWWRPPRPRSLTARPGGWAEPGLRALPVLGDLRPKALVGLGPGLTPSGDDVLAGALVAAHAVADRRLAAWRAATREALAARPTTAVSRGLLHHALDGWATPELADFVVAACHGSAGPALDRLLQVGHSSGAALAAGAWHVLATAARPGDRARRDHQLVDHSPRGLGGPA